MLTMKKNTKRSILITNPGSKSYFIDYLLKLKKKLNFEIFISDNSEYNASNIPKSVKFIKTNLASKNKRKYIDILINACQKYNINLIIPLSDWDLEILSANKRKFNLINCDLLLSDKSLISRLTNKIKFFEFCENNTLLSPISSLSAAKIKSKKIIHKMTYGSASYMQEIIPRNKNKFKLKEGFFFQEFIEGEEYGMDILNSTDGNYVHSFTKKKLMIKNGETYSAVGVYDKKFEILAKKISKLTKHIGVMDIDLILAKNKKIYVIDFNPRFGGGYPITHEHGYNYLEYLLRFYFEKKIIKFPVRKNKLLVSKGISIYSKVL